MPRGGKRANAGRKPHSLQSKLAAGNPNRQKLTKVEFTGTGTVDVRKPPKYLLVMEKREERVGVPSPAELYTETIEYLEPSGCLHLIPTALIANYAMALHHLHNANYELALTGSVVTYEKGRNVSGEIEQTSEMTDFAEAVIKFQKNVHACWTPIWDIVSRNSTQVIDNPEMEYIALLVSGRKRREPKGELPHAYYVPPEIR